MQTKSQCTRTENDTELMFTLENGISFNLTALVRFVCNANFILAKQCCSSILRLLPLCCLKVIVIINMRANQRR